jgi:FMN phosphatase YigB (HAD superfamily)
MIQPKPSKAQFDSIARYINEQGIKLVVSDLNGVLDDYYGTKFEFLEAVLGDHREQHLARLAVQTDTAYIQDRKATLEDTINNYCREHNLELSADGKKMLEKGPKRSVVTPEAKQFLRSLTVPVVIFTAQRPEVLYQTIDQGFVESLGIGVRAPVVKPSVDSLVEVLSASGITASDACMIGDGLIDDLLPAKLLGVHTILVSPFADMHVSE